MKQHSPMHSKEKSLRKTGWPQLFWNVLEISTTTHMQQQGLWCWLSMFQDATSEAVTPSPIVTVFPQCVLKAGVGLTVTDNFGVTRGRDVVQNKYLPNTKMSCWSIILKPRALYVLYVYLAFLPSTEGAEATKLQERGRGRKVSKQQPHGQQSSAE